MDKQSSWVGVLLIAILSGLIIKVVGDPIVEVTSPAVEDFLDDMGDRFEDTMDDIGDWFKGDRHKSNTSDDGLRSIKGEQIPTPSNQG
ncbi:MAG: hypothetical protein SFY66_00955 [Oculatellaceae cyanobacterium bins.114]|nr:hypothetical protein [Oculatellaceae cyanobacterium bins.114]